jgi:hypothetical protein
MGRQKNPKAAGLASGSVAWQVAIRGKKPYGLPSVSKSKASSRRFWRFMGDGSRFYRWLVLASISYQDFSAHLSIGQVRDLWNGSDGSR